MTRLLAALDGLALLVFAARRRPSPAEPAPVELVEPPVRKPRIVPRRLDLRELYDELACEAVERWSAGEPLDAELSTIEALERARRLTVPGAWLGDRGVRC